MKTIGLIGGTGLDTWGFIEEELQIETPFGSTSGPICAFSRERARLLFLPRHGQVHSIAPHKVNYRANLWALRQAGVDHVIAVNAVGGISSRFGPGVLAIPSQLIDYTWGRAQCYCDEPDFILKHFDFSEPFTASLRSTLLHAGQEAGVAVEEGGCIGVTQGPRLETAAEVHKMKHEGCDLVGMTSMPEAALARELGLDYACIAVIANWAAGISDEPITMSGIEQTVEQAIAHVRRLLEQVLGE